ncbi:MAG: phenylalanine--tRNA ligase subunit beta [Streptomycetales bacterium]
MRVPLSWLREYVELPAGESGRAVAARLIRAGLEVETLEELGADVSGPLVVGEVLEIEQLTGHRKPIRWVQVRTGPEAGPRGVICGAANFGVGDKVVVAVPGAVLPGGFEITARKTYGHVSDGMICSERELGLGDDHTGIIVLPPDCEPGVDAVELLGLRDEVLDIAVSPDRGYCLSVRGVARETATAYGVAFQDPAEMAAGAPAGEGHPTAVDDPTACDRFVLCTVSGLDPSRPTPLRMARRLQMAGMRPVSLAVDVTNYLMLELGQPLHAFDRKKLDGPVVVRRGRPGERLETLDHVVRELGAEDILITDATGPISLAGTMGGVHTEIDDGSTDLVIEAAHFPAVGTARMSRTHRLSSEASRRFERGVDPELPPRAAARAAALLAELGGGIAAGCSDVDLPRQPTVITMAADFPSRVAGTGYGREVTLRRLSQIGCAVAADGGLLTVTPPSWRPDLTDPSDLAEEVIRLEGYENLPSRLPAAHAGRGYTPGQRLRRRVGQVLAAAGYVEALSYPFVGEQALDDLGLEPGDDRRRTVRLANPLSDEEPALRTTLLLGLFAALRRNIGRGNQDVALFEMGLVYLPGPGDPPPAPRLAVDRRPDDDEAAALDAALPGQPRHVAVVLAGSRERAGWWGPGRQVCWADAVEAARVVARAARVDLQVRGEAYPPWHPGRCAALTVGGRVVGHAGELHPRVVGAFGLPARTCAMELDLDQLAQDAEDLVPAPEISTYPVATQDVALVVADEVPVAAVDEALREGAGDLLESVRLFDVYTGEQAGPGRRSLAFTLRFRAADRTLTVEETTTARDAAVREATRRTGAVQRAG